MITISVSRNKTLSEEEICRRNRTIMRLSLLNGDQLCRTRNDDVTGERAAAGDRLAITRGKISAGWLAEISGAAREGTIRLPSFGNPEQMSNVSELTEAPCPRDTVAAEDSYPSVADPKMTTQLWTFNNCFRFPNFGRSFMPAARLSEP